MPTINFSGLASGLDTAALIEAILNAERQPVERLQARQSLFSRQKAAYDELNSKLNSFESALRDLSSDRTFRGRTAEVSDESLLTASTSTGAETGQFTIEVLSLAEANKVKADGKATSDGAEIADGTITIQSGENDQIVIDVSAASGNNSLEAVRDAINDADQGVEASIIFDGADYILTVRAEKTGRDNELQITDTTDLNLDTPGNEVTAAANAEIQIDGATGFTITSQENTVTGIIPGVTLNLKSANVGEEVTLTIGQDDDAIVDAVDELVSQYNELIDFFNAQNDTANPGVLSGDSTLRSVQSKVQALFTTGLDGLAVGSIRSLSSIGVDFDGKTGKATLDSTALRDLLDTQFDEIGDLFLTSARADDARIKFVSATGSTTNGEYAVEITQAAEQATLVGSTPINPFSGIGKDETLTITLNGQSTDVLLLKNDTITEIVDKVNTGLQSAGIAVTASDDAGKLRLTSDEYGADVELTVVSDRNDNGNGRRTGFDDTPATDFGEDIAGTIGGVAATVDGNFLTGAEGTEFEGLVVEANVTAADVAATGGDFGTVAYSRGLIDTLVEEVDQLTKLGSGSVLLARDSLDANIKRLEDDIFRIEDRLAIREARLLQTFTAAEQAIAALQAQQAQLGASF